MYDRDPGPEDHEHEDLATAAMISYPCAWQLFAIHKRWVAEETVGQT
jgi:hypothetical protein